VLKEIEEQREAKIRSGISDLTWQQPAIKV
jgi:hypothetical protein